MAFASIYAMSPQGYVLDEPSSNLDISALSERHPMTLSGLDFSHMIQTCQLLKQLQNGASRCCNL